MADLILINMYISKLGLTGKEAEDKRKELAGLSDEQLSSLMSGTKTAVKTDTWGLNGLTGTQNYDGEAFFNYKPNNNEPIFDVPKPKTYNARQEKELRSFAADYLYNSVDKAVKMQKDYHKSIGVFSTDAVVQGSINIGDWIFDSITGRDDYHTLAEQEKFLEKEFNIAEKLRKSVDKKGMFEFNFEKERKIPYSKEAVENLKNKSEEYTKITAYSEKYAQLENGLNDVKSVIRQEEEYKYARKVTRGPAAASLTPPKVSSHEKFGQVLLDFCGGNQELVSKYMSELQTKMGSKQEIEKNYTKILDELKEKCKAEYEKELGGKSFEQHTIEYNNAYKKAFGGENVENLTKSYIETQKTTAAYAEIGITLAASLMLPGSSVVTKGASKLAGVVGEQAAGQIIKGTMTFGMASMPAAITTIGTATSEAGFTDEKKAEILEKWKSGMLYGGLGAYVSGPLGNAVENILKTKPNLLTGIVGKAFNNSSKAVSATAKTVGVTAETSADVVLDLLTNDMDIKASLEQNGVMNVGMMLAGGRLSKMHKNVEGLKIEKTFDNKYNIKDAYGKLVFKAQDENVLTSFIAAKALDIKPFEKTKNNEKTNVSLNVLDAKYYLPPYLKLSKNQKKAVKYIDAQKKSRQIDKRVLDAIENRLDSPIPYAVFKYVDDPKALEEFINKNVIKVPTVEGGTVDIIVIDGMDLGTRAVAKRRIEDIKVLREFLDKQSIPEDINLHRHDNYQIMKNINVGDKSLAELMKEAAASGDTKKVLSILNNNNLNIKYDNFVGTSFVDNKSYYDGSPAIQWELKVPAGTKGAFLESVIKENLMHEMEFLLQAGSEFKITKAEYKNRKWILSAEVVQNAKADKVSPEKTNDIHIKDSDEKFISNAQDKNVISDNADLKSIKTKLKVKKTYKFEMPEIKNAKNNDFSDPDVENIKLSLKDKALLLKDKNKSKEEFLYEKKQQFVFDNNAKPEVQKEFSDAFDTIIEHAENTSIFKDVPEQYENTSIVLPDGTRLRSISYKEEYGHMRNCPEDVLCVDLPDGKSYTLYANSPENIAKAEKLKKLMSKMVNRSEIPEYVSGNAKAVREKAKLKETHVINFLAKYGLGSVGENMTYRLKSEQSINDKIVRLVTTENKSIDKATAEVFDSIGARTEIKAFDYKTNPELAALYKKDPAAAMKRAAEIQSQPMVENIKKLMSDYKNGATDVKIKTVSNYAGENGLPYFSEKQMDELFDFAAENEIKGFTINEIKKTKTKASGYTALQMNFETKDGFVFEWQCRGEEINRFAEAEHVPYDLRQGKDISGGNHDLVLLYDRVENSAKTLSAGDYKVYSNYLKDHYLYLRKKELGFDAEPPKLDERFDKSLSAENLVKLADITHDLKEGKITETNALKSYDEYLNAKQPETKPELSFNERFQNCAQMLFARKDIAKGDMPYIMLKINEQNIGLAEKLCFNKDFPKEEIASILIETNERNIGLAEKLCIDKDFPKEKIKDILRSVYEQNIDLAEKLCIDKDFPKEKIKDILRSVYEQNIDLAEKLCFNKDFPKEEIESILGRTYEQNNSLAEKLCIDKDFPKENIWKILECTNGRNISLAEKLCFDKDFPKEQIWRIVGGTNEQNIDLAEKLCFNKDFPKEEIASILERTYEENISLAEKLCLNYKKMEVSINDILFLLNNTDTVTYRDLQRLKHILGSARMSQIPENDLVTACKFSTLAGKTNINEIPIQAKKKLLRDLVSSNENLFMISDFTAKEFPLLPKNQEEYCALLPSIVRSLGIETNTLKPEDVKQFNKSVEGLSNTLENVSDRDFANLRITQEYTKDEFIKTVLYKVKDLTPEERQKVYDYFGFELHHNKNNQTGFSITGYPVNLNNGKKLAQITHPQTKAVVETLRPDVIRFSENNPIKCGNPEIEKLLNEIVKDLPELHAIIGKPQHETHDFDVMQHSLKVMQKVSQDPKFKTLNESDKKIMLLSSLMHDVTKSEGRVDKTHANESSFDTYFISKKFNLTKAEELKLYTLTRHHEWLEYVNTAKSEEELTKRLQSVAYDLQYDNLADMAVMLSHADLKSVKADNSFHDKIEGSGRVGFDGVSRSYGKSADIYAERIDGYVKELQKSQPLLPVTKIPKAGSMKNAITTINADGTTNIKGVYVDNDGLVIIKYNEVEDWQALGFPEGTSSKGIMAKGVNNNGMECDIETGNIKFFAHGLEVSNQLTKFDAFSLVDSDALLSVSYTERPESKYRFFRTQGVLLDVATKYVHGGGNTDSGSGCGKNMQTFKDNYIFGGERESDRVYVSNLVKEATCMNDAEYVNFVKENSNKSMLEIEPVEIREKIIKAFATINSNVRRGNREYNEMYVSNPEVMAVFAYSKDNKVGNALEFFNYSIGDLDFLKTYALERDIPMVIFGD